MRRSFSLPPYRHIGTARGTSIAQLSPLSRRAPPQSASCGFVSPAPPQPFPIYQFTRFSAFPRPQSASRGPVSPAPPQPRTPSQSDTYPAGSSGEGLPGPITPAQALKRYADQLTNFEQSEVLEYPQASNVLAVRCG